MCLSNLICLSLIIISINCGNIDKNLINFTPQTLNKEITESLGKKDYFYYDPLGIIKEESVYDLEKIFINLFDNFKLNTYVIILDQIDNSYTLQSFTNEFIADYTKSNDIKSKECLFILFTFKIDYEIEIQIGKKFTKYLDNEAITKIKSVFKKYLYNSKTKIDQLDYYHCFNYLLNEIEYFFDVKYDGWMPNSLATYINKVGTFGNNYLFVDPNIYIDSISNIEFLEDNYFSNFYNKNNVYIHYILLNDINKKFKGNESKFINDLYKDLNFTKIQKNLVTILILAEENQIFIYPGSNLSKKLTSSKINDLTKNNENLNKNNYYECSVDILNEIQISLLKKEDEGNKEEEEKEEEEKEKEKEEDNSLNELAIYFNSNDSNVKYTICDKENILNLTEINNLQSHIFHINLLNYYVYLFTTNSDLNKEIYNNNKFLSQLTKLIKIDDKINNTNILFFLLSTNKLNYQFIIGKSLQTFIKNEDFSKIIQELKQKYLNNQEKPLYYDFYENLLFEIKNKVFKNETKDSQTKKKNNWTPSLLNKYIKENNITNENFLLFDIYKSFSSYEVTEINNKLALLSINKKVGLFIFIIDKLEKAYEKNANIFSDQLLKTYDLSKTKNKDILFLTYSINDNLLSIHPNQNLKKKFPKENTNNLIKKFYKEVKDHYYISWNNLLDSINQFIDTPDYWTPHSLIEHLNNNNISIQPYQIIDPNNELIIHHKNIGELNKRLKYLSDKSINTYIIILNNILNVEFLNDFIIEFKTPNNIVKANCIFILYVTSKKIEYFNIGSNYISILPENNLKQIAKDSHNTNLYVFFENVIKKFTDLFLGKESSQEIEKDIKKYKENNTEVEPVQHEEEEEKEDEEKIIKKKKLNNVVIVIIILSTLLLISLILLCKSRRKKLNSGTIESINQDIDFRNFVEMDYKAQ